MFAARRVVARVGAAAAAVPRTAVSAPVTGARLMSSYSKGADGPAATLYRLVFKRNATYVAFVIAGAMVGGAIYDSFMDKVFVAYNDGVRVPPFPFRVCVFACCHLAHPARRACRSGCTRPSTGAPGSRRARTMTMTTMMTTRTTRTRTRRRRKRKRKRRTTNS